MKITQKSITSFNQGNKPSFNDNVNKLKGYHSLKEDALFRIVQSADSGVLKKPISLKKVKEWLETYSETSCGRKILERLEVYNKYV